jgi:hypothetical protein
MPQYYFTIRWVDRVDDDKCGESCRTMPPRSITPAKWRANYKPSAATAIPAL